MGSRKKAKAAAPAGRTKYEGFTMREIARGELKNAPYNPRTIGPAAKKKLRENLRRVGLVVPITWNVRTGNIVSGHQRVAALDALERRRDYLLSVAVVDLDEKTEKEQNIFLNNARAQGEFELEGLEALLAEVDAENSGFDAADIIKDLGVDALDSESFAEMNAALKKSVEAFEGAAKKSAARNSTDYYLVVVFKDHAQRLELTEALGVEDNRYVDGRLLLDLVAGDGHLEKPELPAHAEGAAQGGDVA